MQSNLQHIQIGRLKLSKSVCVIFSYASVMGLCVKVRQKLVVYEGLGCMGERASERMKRVRTKEHEP